MHSKISKFHCPLFCVLLAVLSEAIDHCPAGWTYFERRCYKYNNQLTNWKLAQDECKKDGGHVTEITSAAENAFLVDLRGKAQDSWIGLYRLSNQYPYKWQSSNFVPNFTNWAIGEPRDDSHWQICGEMLQSGKWNVLNCWGKRAFFCERPVIERGDCLMKPCRNGGTCFPIGTHRCSCSHGFSGPNCEDYDWCASNPCLNDGVCVNDVRQFVCFCKPPFTGEVCREKCPTGWTIFQGRCYRLSNHTASWYSALMSCREGGGDLVAITSEKVNDFICHVLQRSSYTSAWIGLNDLGNEARYIWVSSGYDVTFTYWGHKHHSVNNFAAVCVEMEKSGQWDDTKCENNRSYICELSGKETCQEGWTFFEQSCYSIRIKPASWVLAQTLCRKHGGDLVEIESTKENAFLNNLKNNINVGDAWIGLINQGNKDAFVWITSGVVAEFTNWASGQPNDPSPAQDCITTQYSGWNVLKCDSERKYICERSAARVVDQSKPLGNCFPNPCLNGGRCNDKKDNYTCSCRSSFEGRNCEEIKSSHCSSNPCRNGGSCFEGSNYYICYCTSNFIGRNCDETCPDGWTLFERSCYNFIETSVTWTSAETLCRNDGGKLVEINSALENSFLLRLRDNYLVKEAWIGLRKDKVHTTYRWASSGDDAKYTNWARGEPNRAGSLESCVELRRFGTWYDLECRTIRPYFCERKVIVAN